MQGKHLPPLGYRASPKVSMVFKENRDPAEAYSNGKTQMTLWWKVQKSEMSSFLKDFFQPSFSASSRCWGQSEPSEAFKAMTEVAWDCGVVGSGVQPTADLRKIIFTSISLFLHLENRGNKICFPLTSRQCFSDKRLSPAQCCISGAQV